MWHECWPLDDDPTARDEFSSIYEWSVPGIGEVGAAGQPVWLKAHQSTVAIRFSDTFEETPGREARDLPDACLVLSGGALRLDYPPPLPKWGKPARGLGYGLPIISWRAASDDFRVFARGVTLTYQGGLWRWDAEWKG